MSAHLEPALVARPDGFFFSTAKLTDNAAVFILEAFRYDTHSSLRCLSSPDFTSEFGVRRRIIEPGFVFLLGSEAFANDCGWHRSHRSLPPGAISSPRICRVLWVRSFVDCTVRRCPSEVVRLEVNSVAPRSEHEKHVLCLETRTR